MKVDTHELADFQTIHTCETHCPACGKIVRFVLDNFLSKITSNEVEHWKQRTIELEKRLSDIEQIRAINRGSYL